MTQAEQIKQNIQKHIDNNAVLLFMKGTPDEPRCGFSARSVQILKACGVTFGSVDVLAEPLVREFLPQVSNWPTFPQLFVKGELVGGCDIMTELYESGELEKILKD